MRNLALILLAACGTDEPTYDCSAQIQKQAGLECVVPRADLYVDPQTNCIWTFYGNMGGNGECAAINQDGVLIKNSYFMGSKRGVMTQTIDQYNTATFQTCVFRECQ